jgi:hypothetical protein
MTSALEVIRSKQFLTFFPISLHTLALIYMRVEIPKSAHPNTMYDNMSEDWSENMG